MESRVHYLLRASAELEDMPPGLKGNSLSEWVLSTEYLKGLSFNEFDLAQKLHRIAEIIAEDKKERRS